MSPLSTFKLSFAAPRRYTFGYAGFYSNRYTIGIALSCAPTSLHTPMMWDLNNSDDSDEDASDVGYPPHSEKKALPCALQRTDTEGTQEELQAECVVETPKKKRRTGSRMLDQLKDHLPAGPSGESSALGMDHVSYKWLVETKGREKPSAPPLSALLTTPRISKGGQRMPIADDVGAAEAVADDDEDDEEYCFCGTARHSRSNMLPFEGVWVGCDRCGRWCHGECAGVADMRTAAALQSYTCLPCLTPKDPIEAFDRNRGPNGCWCAASVRAVEPATLALCETGGPASAPGSAPAPARPSGPTFSYLVHFRGWSAKWDEWVGYERLRQPRKHDEHNSEPASSGKNGRKSAGTSAGKRAAVSGRSKKGHSTNANVQAETSATMSTEPTQAGEPAEPQGGAAGSAEEELAGILTDALGPIGPMNAEALVEALKARGMFT